MSYILEVPYKSGRTLTCDIFPQGSDTALTTGAVLTEETNRKGTYTATMNDTPLTPFLFTIHVYKGSELVAMYDAWIKGVHIDTYYCTEVGSNVTSNEWTDGSRLDEILDTAAIAWNEIGNGIGGGKNFVPVDDNLGGNTMKGLDFIGTNISGNWGELDHIENSLFKGHLVYRSGSVIDIVYEFNIDAFSKGSNICWTGYLTLDDPLTFYLYDFVGTAWEPVDFTNGIGNAKLNSIKRNIAMLDKHTGTGADEGIVYFRMNATGSSAQLFSNAIFCEAIVHSDVSGVPDLVTDWTDGGRLDLIQDEILVDTDDLQTNQGAWLTATGFSTHAATDIVSAGAITTLAGAVVNVDLVDLTTANTDMRGTDSANTVAPATPTNVSDAQTAIINQGNSAWTTATGFSTLVATDIVSAGAITTLAGSVVNVDLVDLTTANTDMRGTDSANTIAPATPTNVSDAQTAIIAQGDSAWTTATGFSTFNAATDPVANVTLVGTTTTNLDMRGTDSANTVAPDNASIALILEDTDNLQTNQGAWATATGFATPTNVSDAQTAIIANGDSLWATATGFSTPANITDAQTAIIANGDSLWATATGFNTTTPDNASVAAIKTITDQMVFTNTNQLDVNTLAINSTTVIGAGIEADLWRA